MPSREIYAVNFANGNLTPSLDIYGWGDMRRGHSAPEAGHTFNSHPEAEGLHLGISRAKTSGDFVSNSVHVIPGFIHPVTSSARRVSPGEMTGDVALDSRFIIRIEFDSPYATPLPHPEKVDPLPAEPWAVVLKLKLSRDPNDKKSDGAVPVTCQFNSGSNPNVREGARLNTPGALQRDQAVPIDSPLDYDKYQGSSARRPTLFVLEQAFCGVQAQAAPVPPAPTTPNSPVGHAAGCGFLTIGGVGKDLRVFTNTGLSVATGSIGAIGVAIITKNGIGRMSVLLRRFSIATWQ
ncbi:hypothetical protein BH23GEM1_BH23GEM1_10580 [soil metagenome]